jgi:hypothetical protein
VQLTVTDSFGLTATSSTTLTIGGPVSSFAVTPNPGVCGQVYMFDGSASTSTRPDRSIVSYTWNFGDGATASGVTASHAYTAFGSFNVTLTVTDNSGQSAGNNVPTTISPGNAPPSANPGGPYTTNAATGVTFDAFASADPNSACGDGIASYAWLVNGSIPLSGVSPSLTPAQVAALGAGTFPVQLTVTDHSGLTGSASTLLHVQVTTINTVTTLTASATALGALQPVTMTASVTSATGAAVPNGTVTFIVDGTTTAGSAPLINGVATLDSNAGGPGAHQITAQFSGNGSFAPSTSAPLTVTTAPFAASTYTVLVPWTNPQALGTPVTVSAIVLPLDTAPNPTGTVEFYDGGVLVAAAAISGGLATVSFTPPGAGTHTLSARYLGSATMAPSIAPPVQITVFSGPVPVSTQTAVTVSPNPVSLGQAVTFTATVTPATVPAGTVTFYVNGTAVGTVPVGNIGGATGARFTTATLPLGAHVVSASFGGTAGFAASSSTLALVVVR